MFKRQRMSMLLFLVVVASASTSLAKVNGAAAHGFSIEIDTEISDSPDRVYAAIVKQVGKWWEAGHTYSGDASRLYLEPKEKGWFGERLPGGGFVRHMEVVYAQPGKSLRMLGGLGPLQEMGVAGALTLTLSKGDNDNTLVKLKYNVSGFALGGIEKIASPVDQVLSGQMSRLKAFVEGAKDRK